MVHPKKTSRWDPAKSCAILLSRQSLRPSGQTPWVRMTQQAVRWARKNGLWIHSSLGMQTWEMITAMARREGVAQRIIIVATDKAHYEQQRLEAIRQFDLDMQSTDFVPLISSISASIDALNELRDKYILTQSRSLFPVAIRKSGSMERLLRDAADTHIQKIDHRFACCTNRDALRTISYRIDPEAVSNEIHKLDDTYLIHWTRSASGAWPGERRVEYYEAVIDSEQFPRDAFATLCKILDIRHIRASSRHMPGRIATVSFTGSRPSVFLSRMKYRARYREMSFEPYGVGIERESAVHCGVRPVRYHDNSCRQAKESDDEIWLTQSHGRITDWRAENEFRCKGDFDLSGIPVKKLICFCRTSAEARVIEKQFGIRTLPVELVP